MRDDAHDAGVMRKEINDITGMGKWGRGGVVGELVQYSVV